LSAPPAASGCIVARYGTEAVVEGPDGALHRCTARRQARDVVCGDQVEWTTAAEDGGTIEARLPRSNALTRIDGHGRARTIAANVGLIYIVAAPEPIPSWALIDRYLVAASSLQAEAVIVFNKSDLAAMHGMQSTQDVDVYAALGYRVLACSAHSGVGVAQVRDALAGRTGILVGQSGVGKSSLLQALIPERELRIGALSAASGQGRHTTTVATLYRLGDAGALIDSPGVRDFSPAGWDAAALHGGFPEVAARAGSCRFRDCRHIEEPGCAVRAAVEAGEIDARRYRSFIDLRDGATGAAPARRPD
jgi:ribosome biogenesis GTPase